MVSYKLSKVCYVWFSVLLERKSCQVWWGEELEASICEIVRRCGCSGQSRAEKRKQRSQKGSFEMFLVLPSKHKSGFVRVGSAVRFFFFFIFSMGTRMKCSFFGLF